MDTTTTALCLLALFVIACVFLRYGEREGFEILYSSMVSGSGGAPKPPPINATIHNIGDDTYIVDVDSNKLSISTIFLHKPEDEPMLHYVIKGSGPIKLSTLPAGTAAEVWVVESNGRCWSAAPVKLPAGGKTEKLILDMAFCI